ncbi:DUF3761 domain-containing protein [Mycobacterium sp. 94-17]|uniref:DUF3761 domain-containing protein n=1 Tax=Mycobacterium sp. 94-17 TaxID=2986147 RepID=UPI002D1EF18F|nr:DUF3761 domain-containing protein [Mycobacterium sp. 94-17]MEB4209441.1 DUF3761 domain-containing protein [Mycobacterium sp. 94-17]
MRVQLFIAAAAIAGGALAIAPAIVASGPTTILAGCGHGYYQNSDGQCIPHPTAGGGSGVTAGTPPGAAGGTGSDPILVGGTEGNSPGVAGSPGGGGGPGANPPGATAICGDGDYSFSTHRTGTCSRHGGVKQWLGS